MANHAYNVLYSLYRDVVEENQELRAQLNKVNVHGRWVRTEKPLLKCSVCGYYDTGGNYCRNCGAKMEGVTNE